jgi:hypothetical protein
VIPLLFALLCTFDPQVAQRLEHAKTVAELDAVPHDSVPLRALYRRMRLKLHSTADEELRYLDALPKSKTELDCVYDLTNAEEVKNDPAVGETVYDMLALAGRLSLKHGRTLDRFLELYEWSLSNGDLGEGWSSDYGEMLDTHPGELAAALRKLPVQRQKDYCHGFDIRKRSMKFIAAHCHSAVE